MSHAYTCCNSPHTADVESRNNGQLRDAHHLQRVHANIAERHENGLLSEERKDGESDEQLQARALDNINARFVYGSLNPSRATFDQAGETNAQQFVDALVNDGVKLVIFSMDCNIVRTRSADYLHADATEYEWYLSLAAKNFVELIHHLYENPQIDLQVAIITTTDFANYFVDNPQFEQPKASSGSETPWMPSDTPAGAFECDFAVNDELETSMTEPIVVAPLTREGAPKHYHNMLSGKHLVTRFLIHTFLYAFVDDTAREVMTEDETKMATYLEQIIIVARNPAIRAASDTSNHPYNVHGKLFHLKRAVEIHLQRKGYAEDMAEAVYNFLWYHTVLFDASRTSIDFANGYKGIKWVRGINSPPLQYCRAFLVDSRFGFVWSNYTSRLLYPLGTVDDHEDICLLLKLP